MMNADGFAGFSRRQQRMGTRGISPVPGACQSRYRKPKIPLPPRARYGRTAGVSTGMPRARHIR
jgi:hypothetical protein